MGYYTTYDLSIEQDGDVYIHDSDAKKLIAERADYDPFIEQTKWYDHDKDMAWLSKKYPNTVFKLSGIGEEFPDLWHKYFCNGNIQVCTGTVVYPPFNPLLLR